MHIEYEDFVKTLHKVHMLYDKEMANFYKHTHFKQDITLDFILKYVYTNHIDDKKVTMTEIGSLLNESDNTIRSKVKKLVNMNLLIKLRSVKDGRVYRLKPTENLIRLYEIQASRMLKTLLESSHVMEMFFGSWSKGFYKKYNTTNTPSFYKEEDIKVYKNIGKQLNKEYIKSFDINTRKNLG